MSVNLPYLSAPTNIPKVLERIRAAPTPPKVTQDFVKTKLQIPSSSGNEMTTYLRRIGFVAADGSPSDLYTRFRNTKTAGEAVSKAIRIAYSPLYEHNEYAHELSEEDLRGLVVQVTGWAEDAVSVNRTLKCFTLLKAQAKFAGVNEDLCENELGRADAIMPNPSSYSPDNLPSTGHDLRVQSRRVGMNLSYTINLNLPPSTDIAVFNAIFKSLKDNLLRDIDER